MVSFDFDDRAAIALRMGDLAADGSGWINFEPAVDEADLPPADTGLFSFLSARGPQVPLCTWSPPERRGRSHPFVSLGIQHPVGGRVAPLLASVGIEVDPRWRVLQDVPKKGLVVAVPVDDDHDVILEWLLRAGAALCPADFGDRWTAAIYRRA
ncbi:MAG: hypothetical protein QOG64_1276 [Acidimicrobiaceae bacterium]|nr:hypothetical protein [Acidimicrobiaceae bacterium]